MFQQKSKRLFAEISAYQIRLAKTERSANPIQVESFLEIPVTSEDEARRAVENFAGEDKNSFKQAVCAVYPADRFLHRHFAENAARTKSEDFSEKILKDDLKRTPKDVVYKVVNPSTGKAYNPSNSLSRELIFVGAGKTAIRQEQSRALGFGLYPRQLRLASVGLFEGTRRALQEEGIEASTLVLEISEHNSYAYVVSANGLALSHQINFGVAAIAEQIQKELRLQDVLSAEKVMFSTTFDFTDMASSLVGRLIRQIQAITGQFEVRTGKSVSYIYLPGLPPGLSWISKVLALELGMESWEPSLEEWLMHSGLQIPDDSSENLVPYFSLLCQMADLQSKRT